MRRELTRDIRSIVVKVGTSVLTTKGRFDRKVIASLAAQVSRFLRRGVDVYLVSSGAIGSGMTILKLNERPKAMSQLQAAAAIGQRYLMECYEAAFSRHGYSTGQVLLTWDDLAQRKRFLNAKNTLLQIRRWGLVPVINENDTVATEEIRFGDNDRLSCLISILVEADALVILSDTDGLHARDAEGRDRRIQVVDRMGEAVFAHVREHASAYTVGGMRAKLKSVQDSVDAGIPVFLACGRDRDVLTRLFRGEDLGTLFLPAHPRGHVKKHWLDDFLRQVQPSAAEAQT